MFIKQSEIFLGTSMDFVKKFMDISQMTSHAEGDVLFRENDPARHFYVLINGSVKLSVGDPARVVYSATRHGEAFGWSSLIGRADYSASAQCEEPTKLLKTDSARFSDILEKDPSNSFVFFKQLAATLGNRLLESYKAIEKSSNGGEG